MSASAPETTSGSVPASAAGAGTAAAAPSSTAAVAGSRRVAAGRACQTAAPFALVASIGVLAAFAGADNRMPQMPVVLGPVVIPDLLAYAVGIIAAVPLLLLGISLALRLSAPEEARRRARGRREALRNGISVLCALASLPVLFVALLPACVYGPAARVGAPGPQGAQFVVIERHFLLLSSGDVFLARGPIGIPERIAAFQCDDAYSPLSAGSIAVSWRGARGTISITSTSAVDPMEPCIASVDVA